MEFGATGHGLWPWNRNGKLGGAVKVHSVCVCVRVGGKHMTLKHTEDDPN